MVDLTKGVVSFELSQSLAEFINEESYWYWVKDKDLPDPFLENYQDCKGTDANCYPAYTVGELGKIIIERYAVELPTVYLKEGEGVYWEYVRGVNGESISDFFEEKEADARAILLYGLCNGDIILSGLDNEGDKCYYPKENNNDNINPPKRKRGRPRKVDMEDNIEQPKKRKRGRPRKNETNELNEPPKRKRGRPRKSEQLSEVKTYEGKIKGEKQPV